MRVRLAIGDVSEWKQNKGLGKCQVEKSDLKLTGLFYPATLAFECASGGMGVVRWDRRRSR